MRCHVWLHVLMTAFCIAAGRVSAQAQQPNSVDAWKQRKITLSVQNQSLAIIAGELADKTGRSILIEGEPERSRLDLSKTDTAEALLNEVANAFDYTWHVSKDGVLLFNKRFRSRTEAPQIVVPELIESIADVLAAVHSLPIADVESRSVQDQMAALLHSLAPIQLRALRQGSKLPINSLSADQRILAEQAIYVHVFGSIANQWQELSEQLSGVEAGALQNNRYNAVNSNTHQQETRVSLALRYGDARHRQAGIVNQVIAGNDEKARSIAASGMGNESKAAADPLHGVTTLEKAVQAFSRQAITPLAVTPSLASRRLIVQFRGATVSQAMNAFAELEDWTWRTSANGPPMLSRTPPRIGISMDEVRQAVANALPADMRRFLTAAPALANKEAIFPTGLAVYAAHETAVRVYFKMGDQERSEAEQFYLSLPPVLLNQQIIPCTQLTPAQRDRLHLILTLKACASSAMNFTSIFDTPASYETNSAAYLYLYGTPGASGTTTVLIGGDITATQRGGAFGTSVMLDTLAPPVYKMQKLPVSPH